jgi:hypothetical protein
MRDAATLRAPHARLWHGWQRAPLEPSGSLQPLRLESGFAYFGIIPRALLGRLEGAGAPLHAGSWNEVAPWLEQSAQLGLEEARAARPELSAWLEAARSAHVLCVSQSAALCSAFAYDLVERMRWGDVQELDLWLIKEGHTASVWRADIQGDNQRFAVAINVGRDDEASRELAASYEQLLAWHGGDPDHVATPLGIQHCTTPARRQSRGVEAATIGATVVTAHAWVQGRELHARPKPGPTEAYAVAEFIEIEGFSPEARTLRLRAVGRVLEPSEQEQTWDQLLDFHRRHQRVDGQGRILAPGARVNDGDFVRTDGELVAVAASGEPWSPSAEEWASFSRNPYVEWRPGGPRLSRPGCQLA